MQIDAAGALDTLHGAEHRFDFAQLDAVSHVLDLEVLAGDIDHFAVFTQTNQVARAIDRLRPRGIQRVLHKAGGRALRIFEISQGYGGAADAELAGFARSGLAVILREEQNALIGERNADGQRLSDIKGPVHDVVGAVAGDFRRPIKIDNYHQRCQVLAP